MRSTCTTSLWIMLIAVNANATDLSLFNLSLEELAQVKITVSAPQTESLLMSPAVVSRYRSDDLRALGIRSLAGMLELLPGVTVVNNSIGNQSVMVRGISEAFNQKVLFLIDDAPYWMPSHGDIPLEGIPLDAIDTVEVIRGPGAVIYGTNASAGVIKVTTRKQTDGVVAAAGGSHGNRYVSGRNSWTLGEGELIVAAESMGDDGYVGEFRNMSRPAGFPADLPVTGDVDLERRGSSGLVQYHSQTTHALLTAFETSHNGFAGSASLMNTAEMEQSAELAHVDHEFMDEDTRWNLFLDYNRYALRIPTDNVRITGSDGLPRFVDTVQQFDNNAKGNIRTRGGVTWQRPISTELDLFAGAEYESRGTERYVLRERSSGATLSELMPSESLWERAMFWQLDAKPWQDWRFVAGARHVDNSLSGSEWMPRASAVWQLDALQSIKVLYAVGFNSPTLRQQFHAFPGVINDVRNLTPEYIRSAELAYTWLNDEAVFVLNTYRLQTEDVIGVVNDPGTSVVRYENALGFVRRGIELDYQQRGDTVTLFLNGAWQREAQRALENDITAMLAPRWLLGGGASLNLSAQQALGASLRYVGERGVVSGYTQLNLNYRWGFEDGFIDTTLTNALDEEIHHPDLLTLNMQREIPGGDPHAGIVVQLNWRL